MNEQGESKKITVDFHLAASSNTPREE